MCHFYLLTRLRIFLFHLFRFFIPIQAQGLTELWQELVKDNPELDKVKSETRELVMLIAKTPAEKDVRKCIHSFVNNILQNKDIKRVEELSELTQNFYQVFAKRMENSPNYAGRLTFKMIHFLYHLKIFV